jgi:hypothetical protein
LKYLTLARTTVLGALSILPSRGEICEDVLASLRGGSVSVRLVADYAWYVPGETVTLSLSFHNRSNVVKAVPADARDLVGDVEALTPFRLPENGDVVWTSVATRVPPSPDYKPCATTVVPKLLAPGERYEVPLVAEGARRAGARPERGAISAPGLGSRRLQFTSGTFQIAADIVVVEAKLKDQRCLLRQDGSASAFRCRKLHIYQTGRGDVALLSAYWTDHLTQAELRYMEDGLSRWRAGEAVDPLVGMERVYSAGGGMRLLGSPAFRLNYDEVLKFMSDSDQHVFVFTAVDRPAIELP